VSEVKMKTQTGCATVIIASLLAACVVAHADRAPAVRARRAATLLASRRAAANQFETTVKSLSIIARLYTCKKSKTFTVRISVVFSRLYSDLTNKQGLTDEPKQTAYRNPDS